MKIKTEDIILKLFSLYIILKPLYVFESLPFQPADMLLVANLVSLYFLGIRKRSVYINENVRKVISLYLIIILYQCLVNLFSYLIVSTYTLESMSLLRNNLYYIFNFLVLIYVYRLYRYAGDKIFRAFASGSFYSMVIVLIGLVASFGRTSRNMSFFDNPNQLGYYALIMLTAVTMLDKYYSSFKRIIVIGISLLSLLVSGSKAAVIGAGILYGFIVLKSIISGFRGGNLKAVFTRKVLPILIIGVIILFNYSAIFGLLAPYYNSFIHRLDAVNPSNLSLGDSRGYSRIGEIGVNVIFGVGEGAFYRFSTMTGNETHSSFATVIVSYGIIGSLMYLRLIWKSVGRKIDGLMAYLYFFSGILFYWVSHNGLRHSLFWILVLYYVILQSSSVEKSGQVYEEYKQEQIVT